MRPVSASSCSRADGARRRTRVPGESCCLLLVVARLQRHRTPIIAVVAIRSRPLPRADLSRGPAHNTGRAASRSGARCLSRDWGRARIRSHRLGRARLGGLCIGARGSPGGATDAPRQRPAGPLAASRSQCSGGRLADEGEEGVGAEAGAAHQTSIYLRVGHEPLEVVRRDAAPVEDAKT